MESESKTTTHESLDGYKPYAVLAHDQTTGGAYPLEHYSVWWFDTEEKARKFAMRGGGHNTYFVVRVTAEINAEKTFKLTEIP